ncbi:acyl-CoA thioester hydrolase/BAAT C-terminal domain-containing protein [Lacimicrobium alkaliphilum]|uniref:Dienelactone hydrolase n=1 Tax=Lacimicrobium alkaliphilum TaxID=1526571 RepID=A0A0U2RQ86_9ALTE|nr:acyl-CoA thioester hydrolase/BAAT C-terminal domain-containing protein [Lacimicrobium alkaliphilum]ALS99546.1 dienelactone hydrolase [Lacimicrobium alkaliphilum]
MLNKFIKLTLVGSLLISHGIYASVTDLNRVKDGLVGKYYPSSSVEQRVAVLVLGGSEGGIPEKLAEPVVEAGYPTLALAYFNADGLPEELEKIPLEYFTQAKSWLKNQSNVKPDELIIVGWSKGAELALLLATKDEQISRVVAIAPSSVVWAGILKDWTKVPSSSWTEKGQALAHVPFKPSGQVNGLRDLYTQSLANRVDGNKADIPVNHISAQVVLMTGGNDAVWPAPQMANEICQKMNEKRENRCEHLHYNDLDHLLNYQFLEKDTAMYRTFINKLKGG